MEADAFLGLSEKRPREVSSCSREAELQRGQACLFNAGNLIQL